MAKWFGDPVGGPPQFVGLQPLLRGALGACGLRARGPFDPGGDQGAATAGQGW